MEHGFKRVVAGCLFNAGSAVALGVALLQLAIVAVVGFVTIYLVGAGIVGLIVG